MSDAITTLSEPHPNFPLWRRVDRRFWWNEDIVSMFLEAGVRVTSNFSTMICLSLSFHWLASQLRSSLDAGIYPNLSIAQPFQLDKPNRRRRGQRQVGIHECVNLHCRIAARPASRRIKVLYSVVLNKLTVKTYMIIGISGEESMRKQTPLISSRQRLYCRLWWAAGPLLKSTVSLMRRFCATY